MSANEQVELYEGMKQTRSIIIGRLEEFKTNTGSSFDSNELLEYLWDLWVISGILDHELAFKDLEAAKVAAISKGQEPDFTYQDFK